MRKGWERIKISFREQFGNYQTIYAEGKKVTIEGYEQFSFAVTISTETAKLPKHKQRYVVTEMATGCAITPIRCKTIAEAIATARETLEEKGGSKVLGQAIANLLVGKGRQS